MRVQVAVVALTAIPMSLAAQTWRLGMVAQPPGSPVVLEASESTDGQLHSRVTVRNVSKQAIAAVTFALTVGDGPGVVDGEAWRRAESVTVDLKPGARASVNLRSFPSAAVAALAIDRTSLTAELAIVGVTYRDGTQWAVPSSSAWLSRPNVKVGARCIDSSGQVLDTGTEVVDLLATKRCRADGLLEIVSK